MHLEGPDVFQLQPIRRLPKYRLNFETALIYDRCVAGDRLRTVMSSITRRRRGLKSAISILLSEE
jgi:hypothetical protein